jgi:hypothetical protein
MDGAAYFKQQWYGWGLEAEIRGGCVLSRSCLNKGHRRPTSGCGYALTICQAERGLCIDAIATEPPAGTGAEDEAARHVIPTRSPLVASRCLALLAACPTAEATVSRATTMQQDVQACPAAPASARA